MQVFKREGLHFDVLVCDASPLSGMLAAMCELESPADPDIHRKAMEEACGVRQEVCLL